MKKNLKSLKNEYDTLTELIRMDLTNWDPRTKAGVQGRQNAAKIRIEEVKRDLAYLMISKAKALVLLRNHPETEKAIELAKGNSAATVLIDTLMLEKKMAKQLYDSKTTSFSVNSHTINQMNVLLSEVGKYIDAISMPAISGSAKDFFTTTDRSKIVDKMEELIYNALGTDLKRIFFQKKLQDEALSRLSQENLNIIFVNVNENLVDQLNYSQDTSVLSNEQESNLNLSKTPPVRKRVRKTVETAPTPAQSEQPTTERTATPSGTLPQPVITPIEVKNNT